MKIFSLFAIAATTVVSFTSAFSPSTALFGSRRASSSSINMITITEGVSFDTIAREWRCKWSADGDKVSLVAAQKALEAVADDLKKVPGVKKIDRVVCGGCLDFKVVTSLSAEDFANWEENKFAPEAEFLDMLKAIDDVSVIETQTYTIMPV